MISVSDISKSFRGTVAVDSLSCRIDRGEIYGIVGPDGAGKSTLLRMMAAILKPDTGNIAIDGTDVEKNPFIIKEKLAYMPQRFGLYEDLTVEENIFFFGRLFGMTIPAIRKKLPMLYEFSSLAPFKNRYAGKLSGGMKQKLGLACCLVHAPQLIMLDEPTNGVDPVSRREFWKILYELLFEGVTIIVSTSYLDEAERCNRIGLMYDGHFIKEGTPKAIRTSMGKKMLEITADDTKRAESILQKSRVLPDVIRSGNTLKVLTPDTKKTRNAVTNLLKMKGIYVTGIREVIPSLEDCLIDIILNRENYL